MKSKVIVTSLFLFFLSLLQITCFSQDRIYLKSNFIQKGKVIEVTTEKVRYKKIEITNSPIFELLKEEVIKITYANGYTDYFDRSYLKTPVAVYDTIISSTDNYPNPPFEIGIEGGPNVSIWYGDSYWGNYFDYGIAFSGGFTFQYNFSKVFSIRTNISFERKSVNSKHYVTVFGDEWGMAEARVKNSLDYLILPILIRSNFGKRVKFFVDAGPYFGLLLQAREIDKMMMWDTTIIQKKTYYLNFDFGISAGLGISIPIGDHFLLSIEARDNLGLLPILDTWKIAKVNSTNLLMGLAYRFD
ncbi:MAG: porin family protein [Bacteroidetes bacterium]|nr:porin family protein [Bacteroidota bacterium]